jgi:ankyrin repeat protein
LVLHRALPDLYINNHLSNKNQSDMKTQNVKSVLKRSTALTLLAILVLSACTGNQEKSTEVNKEESKAVVKAPSMDIHTATLLGDIDVIKQHIAAGSDVDEPEPTMGSSPLISAAVFGKTEVARALIEAGADVNLQNNEGSTALHSAAFLCRLELVEMLLEKGADKGLLNNYGSTAQQSVLAPFEDVKPIYDQFSKDLGPLGFKLDYAYVEATRPVIAEMLK